MWNTFNISSSGSNIKSTPLLGQLPLFEINNALLLLSTDAIKIGFHGWFAIAKSLAAVAPKTNEVITLNVLEFLILCS